MEKKYHLVFYSLNPLGSIILLIYRGIIGHFHQV